MERRSFLSGSAAALGVAGLGTTLEGCGAAVRRPVLGEVETAELFTRLERGLEAIRDLPDGALSAEVPWELRPDRHETLLRMGVQALIVADVNRSIPPGTDAPAALRARIAEEVPLLEQAVGSYYALLSRMPAAARRNLDRRVREIEGAERHVAEFLEPYAQRLSVATESRALLYDEISNVTARIRRQSASAVIDEALEKVDRVVSRNAAVLGHATAVTTVAMIESIWQVVDGAGGSSGAAAPAPPSAYVSAEATYVEPTVSDGRWNERWARPGDSDIEVGAILMPFGLLTCTILLWVGLGILIHGMNVNGSWDGRSELETRGY